MHKRAVTVILITLSFTACSTFELEGRGAFTPESHSGSETVHGSLYGFKWREFSPEKCLGENLFRVESHTNAGLLLVSVLSLGLYVPQTVEWWCAAPQIDEDVEEQWDPNTDSLMELNDGGR